ncbi:MAG: alpha/beta fold hydrolase [Pseudomonadota bacterium]
MAKRRLATILAIDVVGYSALMKTGTDRVLAALSEILRGTLRPAVKAHDGRIVKLLGDGALIEFGAAQDAVLCAAEIQSAMQSKPPPYDYPEKLALRMGIHAGDVSLSGNDIFGESVNIAARLEAAAPAGGILVSKLVADLSGRDLPVIFKDEGVRRLKNISEPISVLTVAPIGQIDTARANTKLDEDIRFANSTDGVILAWTSTGEGPPLIRAPAWISRIDIDQRAPHLGHFIRELSQDYRLIRFDARGNGLSDRDIGELSFDSAVDDLKTIFDAAGVSRAPLLGMSQGCAVASAFASRYPEHVSGIVMIGGFALGRAKRPGWKDPARAKALQEMMKIGWDDEAPSLRDLMAESIVPLASLEDRRRFAADMLEMVTPDMGQSLSRHGRRYRRCQHPVQCAGPLPGFALRRGQDASF